MLKVSEIFGPTIQGEGKSVGKEVIFLRLANCNLHCIWCDTPYTWNWEGTKFVHPKKHSFHLEVHRMDIQMILVKIFSLNHLNKNSVKALVISGGEPLIQQEKLIPLVEFLKSEGWWIEIETNGTIIPTPKFLSFIDQINCSPKLSNSGMTYQQREKPEALRSLSESVKTNFKFVVSTEVDTLEILDLVDRYDMKEVYLMPMGKTVEELDKTRETTQILCKKYNFNFSDRLHVVQFGGKRGV